MHLLLSVSLLKICVQEYSQVRCTYTQEDCVENTVRSSKYLATAEFSLICSKTEKSNSISPCWDTFDYRISKLVSSHIAQQMPHWLKAAALPWHPKQLSVMREAFHSQPGLVCKVLSIGGSTWLERPVSPVSPDRATTRIPVPAPKTGCNYIWLLGESLAWHPSPLQRLSIVVFSQVSLVHLCRCNCWSLWRKARRDFQGTWSKLLPDFNQNSEIATFKAWNLAQFPAFIHPSKNGFSCCFFFFFFFF